MLQDDAALVAQVPVGTVKARLHRAQTQLRREVAHILNHTQQPSTDVEQPSTDVEEVVSMSGGTPGASGIAARNGAASGQRLLLSQ